MREGYTRPEGRELQLVSLTIDFEAIYSESERAPGTGVADKENIVFHISAVLETRKITVLWFSSSWTLYRVRNRSYLTRLGDESPVSS